MADLEGTQRRLLASWLVLAWIVERGGRSVVSNSARTALWRHEIASWGDIVAHACPGPFPGPFPGCLQDAKAELDRAQKEIRHVDSQVCCVRAVLSDAECGARSARAVLPDPECGARSGRKGGAPQRAGPPGRAQSLDESAANPAVRFTPGCVQRNRLTVQLEEVEGQLREARQVRMVCLPFPPELRKGVEWAAAGGGPAAGGTAVLFFKWKTRAPGKQGPAAGGVRGGFLVARA